MRFFSPRGLVLGVGGWGTKDEADSDGVGEFSVSYKLKY